MIFFLFAIFYISNAQIQTCPDTATVDCDIYTATYTFADATLCCQNNDKTFSKYLNECYAKCNLNSLQYCGECCDPSLADACDSGVCQSSTLDSKSGVCVSSSVDSCSKTVTCNPLLDGACKFRGADYECLLDDYKCYSCQLPSSDTTSSPASTDNCDQTDICNFNKYKVAGDSCRPTTTAGTWSNQQGICTTNTADDDGCLICEELPTTTNSATKDPDATSKCAYSDSCVAGTACVVSATGAKGVCIEDRWSGCTKCRPIYDISTTSSPDATKGTETTNGCDRTDKCNWSKVAGDPCSLSTVSYDRGECIELDDGCLACKALDDGTTSSPDTSATEADDTDTTTTDADDTDTRTTDADDTDTRTTKAGDSDTTATNSGDSDPDTSTSSGPETSEEPDCNTQRYPFKRAKRGECDDDSDSSESCKLVIGLTADVCNINGFFTAFSIQLQLKVALREVVNELENVASECDLDEIRAFGLDVEPILNNVDEDVAQERGLFTPLTKDKCPDLDAYCGEDGTKPNFEVSINIGLKCGSCKELMAIRDALAQLVFDGTISTKVETKLEEVSATYDSVCGQGLRDVILLEDPTATLYGEDGSEITTVLEIGSGAYHHVMWFSVVAVLLSLFF